MVKTVIKGGALLSSGALWRLIHEEKFWSGFLDVLDRSGWQLFHFGILALLNEKTLISG